MTHSLGVTHAILGGLFRSSCLSLGRVAGVPFMENTNKGQVRYRLCAQETNASVAQQLRFLFVDDC